MKLSWLSKLSLLRKLSWLCQLSQLSKLSWLRTAEFGEKADLAQNAELVKEADLVKNAELDLFISYMTKLTVECCSMAVSYKAFEKSLRPETDMDQDQHTSGSFRPSLFMSNNNSV